jgi:hypothetical protein
MQRLLSQGVERAEGTRAEVQVVYSEEALEEDAPERSHPKKIARIGKFKTRATSFLSMAKKSKSNSNDLKDKGFVNGFKDAVKGMKKNKIKKFP